MRIVVKILILSILILLSGKFYSQENHCCKREQLICDSLKRQTLVWGTDYAKGEWYLIRGKKLNSATHTIQQLITAWNKTYSPEIKLKKAERSIIHIKIVNDNGFAQRYGTTGALRVLSSLVYTLTEDSRYKYVFLDFEEGEHASPGKYSRADFVHDFLICD